jgi:hypothetical protein
MKKIMRVAIIVSLFLTGIRATAAADRVKQMLKSSDTILWAGLDYTMVRMIRSDAAMSTFDTIPLTADHYDFSKVRTVGADGSQAPGNGIFPDMLAKWNELFVEERIQLVAKDLGKRVRIDIRSVMEKNQSATTNQIIRTPGPEDMIAKSHITQEDIAREVRSYKFEETSGLGLVFIVDRLSGKRYGPEDYRGTRANIMAAAAIYVVFFDLGTREVVSAKRETHSVTTAGNFRNFWFGPIKDTASSLRSYK